MHIVLLSLSLYLNLVNFDTAFFGYPFQVLHFIFSFMSSFAISAFPVLHNLFLTLNKL